MTAVATSEAPPVPAALQIPIDWPAIERQCRALLPPRGVVAARQELLAYDCDGLTLHRHQPPLVVLPETTDQVSAVVRLCHQQGVPFVARGSGTGLSGGAVAETGAASTTCEPQANAAKRTQRASGLRVRAFMDCHGCWTRLTRCQP